MCGAGHLTSCYFQWLEWRWRAQWRLNIHCISMNVLYCHFGLNQYLWLWGDFENTSPTVTAFITHFHHTAANIVIVTEFPVTGGYFVAVCNNSLGAFSYRFAITVICTCQFVIPSWLNQTPPLLMTHTCTINPHTMDTETLHGNRWWRD